MHTPPSVFGFSGFDCSGDGGGGVTIDGGGEYPLHTFFKNRGKKSLEATNDVACSGVQIKHTFYTPLHTLHLFAKNTHKSFVF